MRQDLPAEQRALIRALHRLEPWRNVRVILFFGIWLAAALIALHVPVLAVRLLCYFLIGATIQGLVILMHEGGHRIMVRNRGLNRWVAVGCGVPWYRSRCCCTSGSFPRSSPGNSRMSERSRNTSSRGTTTVSRPRAR